ncbi:hypothetical protein OPV22_005898 [Ensete ventricosum]|uniref:Uncharacterized protein n=1 Tax=Ensete ventricosum TaxID=4639 RepID=A0AAV8QAB9_ENSVE|nr:hypothetical protein OPV22_005898 [Ensete ventricosum]
MFPGSIDKVAGCHVITQQQQQLISACGELPEDVTLAVSHQALAANSHWDATKAIILCVANLRVIRYEIAGCHICTQQQLEIPSASVEGVRTPSCPARVFSPSFRLRSVFLSPSLSTWGRRDRTKVETSTEESQFKDEHGALPYACYPPLFPSHHPLLSCWFR